MLAWSEPTTTFPSPEDDRALGPAGGEQIRADLSQPELRAPVLLERS
jgi:hypothetical protein